MSLQIIYISQLSAYFVFIIEIDSMRFLFIFGSSRFFKSNSLFKAGFFIESIRVCIRIPIVYVAHYSIRRRISGTHNPDSVLCGFSVLVNIVLFLWIYERLFNG